MDSTCVSTDTVLYSQPDPPLKKANVLSAPLHINVFVTKCKKNLKTIDESQIITKQSRAAESVITRESPANQIDVIKKDVQNVQLLGRKPPVITIYTSNAPPTETQLIQAPSLDGSVIIVEHISKINSEADHQNSIYSSSTAQKCEDASHKCEFEECEYSSHNKHYLKQHIDIVHNTDRPYKCPFCDYAGKRSHSLREHLVVHSNERPYECSHCNATFRKKGHLTNHIKMHTSQKISKCSLCDETMTENVDYYVHLRTVHNMEAIYTCDSCEYASTKWNNLTLHMQVHSKTTQSGCQTTTKCNLCEAVMKENNDLYSHLRSVHGNDEVFSCELCNYATTQKGILALHMKVHKDPMYKCKKCGITMFNFDSLAGHSEEICNRMCMELKSPQAKSNTSQDAIMLMKCTECGFTANNKEDMRDHMWSHIDRNVLSPLPDTITGKVSLASKKSDFVANELSNSKQSTYQCSECQYSCREAFTFKAHMQSHKLKLSEIAMVTERPHSREGMPFTHDSHLDRFSCTICGYTCEYQRTIKAHIWKHSGHRDVDYPMFQNGPLSIYDESPIVKEAASESNVVTVGSVKTVCTPAKSNESITMSQVCSSSDGTSSLSPVLIHLLSSKPGSVMRDMATLNNEEMDSIQKLTTQNVDGNFRTNVSTSSSHDVERPKSLSIHSYSSSGELKRKHGFVPSLNDTISNLSKKLCAEGIHGCRNVVVESIRSAPSNSDLTGLKSQQSSPRVPDVGASCEVECILDPLADQEHDNSMSSKVLSPRNLLNNIECRRPIMSEIKQSNTMHSGLLIEAGEAFIPPYSNVNVGAETIVSETAIGSLYEENETGNIPLPVLELMPDEATSEKEEGNDSALTLLSLLKKTRKPLQTDSNTNTAKFAPEDGKNDKDATEDLTEDGNEDQSKPKSGICSSLLAVIEQLRDRTKSDNESEENGNEETGKKPKKKGKKLSPNVSNNIEDLVNIEKMESCDVKYRCRLCHYSNNSALQMRQHMRLHKTKKPFECSLCEFIASSSWSLQDHMIQHCKVRLYQCKQCDVAFNYKSQLRAHMRSHNDIDLREPYLCESCDFESLDYFSFRDHVKTHKGNLLCDGFSYANLQIDSEENLKAYSCENCEFITNDHDDFIHHDKICRKEVHCPHCSFSCSNMTSYRHHSKLHEEEMALKCDMCDFSAVSSRSLKSHMKRHINDQRYVQQPLEQYKCNICGYVCHHLPSLKSHLWRHASDKNYSYEFTNEIINAAIDYDARSDGTESEKLEGLIVLDALMKKAIEVDKELADQNVDAVTSACFVTFRCCQCGFETINKADLNVHMRSHKDIIQRTLEVLNVSLREKR